MNFNRRLLASFAFPVLLFGAGLAVSQWALFQTQAEFGQYISKEKALADGAYSMYAQGLQMGQALRNILLDPANPRAFENLATASKEFERSRSDARALIAGTSVAGALDEIGRLVRVREDAQAQVLASAKIDGTAARHLLNTAETPAWRELKARLLELHKDATKSSLDRYQQVIEHNTRYRWFVGLLGPLATLVAAWLGWRVHRTLRHEIGGDPVSAREALSHMAKGDLSRPITVDGDQESLMAALVETQRSMRLLVEQVQDSSARIQVASSEVAQGNLDLSSRTEQTASNLQQTAASLDRLTGNVQQSADAARQANELASGATEVAVRGGQMVAKVVTTMDEIQQSSRQISDITGVIDGIAFQTNILALNAAVEAARAGEQGRGFAVVAGEVRVLAQRCAQAAHEIKGLIGASVDRVESGSQLVAESGQTMSEIVGSVQRVSDIIGAITSASVEQSSGIGHVNDAVAQLDHMTQQNAAMVEESAAAAESLRDQARRLTEVLAAFRIA